MFSTKYRYLFVALLGAYSYLNIKFTEGDTLVTVPLSEVAFFGLVLLLVLLLWEGNRLVDFLLSSKLSGSLGKRLITQFGVSLIVVAAITFPASLAVSKLYGQVDFLLLVKIILGFTFRVNLFLHCVNAIVLFSQTLSAAKLEAERLKKETSEAQFEALKNQINPHFLFNSFNALSSLIESDPKTANTFLDQLSKVYRYLLRTKDEKITLLSDELDFLDAYLFLLKTRYRENLSVEISVGSTENTFIPPATLQMLIENSIKHNEVSSQKNLHVTIARMEDKLVVSNNRNEKRLKEESSNIGLQNITNRYILLGSEPPTVKQTTDEFVVTVPLFKD